MQGIWGIRLPVNQNEKSAVRFFECLRGRSPFNEDETKKARQFLPDFLVFRSAATQGVRGIRSPVN